MASSAGLTSGLYSVLGAPDLVRTISTTTASLTEPTWERSLALGALAADERVYLNVVRYSTTSRTSRGVSNVPIAGMALMGP